MRDTPLRDWKPGDATVVDCLSRWYRIPRYLREAFVGFAQEAHKIHVHGAVLFVELSECGQVWMYGHKFIGKDAVAIPKTQLCVYSDPSEVANA